MVPSLSRPQGVGRCRSSCPRAPCLLLASNTRVFRAGAARASGQTRRAADTFSTIIAGTLVSGQFVAASIMSWMLASGAIGTEPTIQASPRTLAVNDPTTQICPIGSDWARGIVLSDRLAAGKVTASLWGRRNGFPLRMAVWWGGRLLDESLLRGVLGMSWKLPGNQVYAGSISSDGARRSKSRRSQTTPWPRSLAVSWPRQSPRSRPAWR